MSDVHKNWMAEMNRINPPPPDYEVWIVQHLPFPVDRLLIFLVRLLGNLGKYIYANGFGVWMVSAFFSALYIVLWIAPLNFMPYWTAALAGLILAFDLAIAVLGVVAAVVLAVRLHVIIPIRNIWRETAQDYPVQKKKEADRVDNALHRFDTAYRTMAEANEINRDTSLHLTKRIQEITAMIQKKDAADDL